MSLSVALPSCSSFRAKRIDFAPYMGGKLDKIVPSIVETLRSELASGENSPATWNTVIAAVRSDFLPWLATAGVALSLSLIHI